MTLHSEASDGAVLNYLAGTTDAASSGALRRIAALVAAMQGAGSPEGVLTAAVGSLYTDTTNGVLYIKATGTGNTGWAAAGGISASIVDAKGDIIAASAADTVARLAVGTDGKVLSANSATATGLEWVTPSAGATTIDGLTDAYLDATAKNLWLGREVPAALSGAIQNVALSGDGTALDSITSGDYNVAIGPNALTAVTTTSSNIGIGADAGKLFTGGSSVFIGPSAGLAATSGSYNTYVGAGAGTYTTDASYNTAVGYQALLNTSDGQRSTAVGYQAGQTATHGYSNTCVGWQADVDSANRNDVVVVGKGIASSASDGAIAIGSAGVTGNIFRVASGLVTVGGKPLVHAYAAKATTYTVTTADKIIDCTSGTFTVTLPTAASITGQEFVIKNSGTGVITLGTTSSQTVDGATTRTLNQYDSVTVVSNGANWIVI